MKQLWEEMCADPPEWEAIMWQPYWSEMRGREKVIMEVLGNGTGEAAVESTAVGRSVGFARQVCNWQRVYV